MSWIIALLAMPSAFAFFVMAKAGLELCQDKPKKGIARAGSKAK